MGKKNPKAALEAFKAQYSGWSNISTIKRGSQGEILVYGNTTLKPSLPSMFQNTKVIFKYSPVRKTA